jgi:hypothetical protein
LQRGARAAGAAFFYLLLRFSALAARFSISDFAGFFLDSFFRSIPLLICSLPS